MPKPQISIPQEQIVQFCQRHHIQRLELFGSVLREDFHPNSDVDLLVEFAPEAQIGFLALSRMQRELTALLHRPVDLVPREGLKPLIRTEILTSAEVLYAT